jgi:8-oxo-dGTP pyrophosphatase MutT (NUDIX family)
MTAIRETFEETGLLLASGVLPQSEAILDASRESIHTGRTLFRDFLKQHALSADVQALLPFTEWITPLGYSRCVSRTSPTAPTNCTPQQTVPYNIQPLPHAFLRRLPTVFPTRFWLLIRRNTASPAYP